MAANGPQKRLALDTNVFLDLAEERDFAWEFVEVFQGAGYALCFPPTVLEELVFASLEGTARERALAAKTLLNVESWVIRSFGLSSIQEALAERFAQRLLDLGLLPPEEANDASILAEASVADIPLLVTSDKHLLNIDDESLLLAFNDADLTPVNPAHPKRLLRALR
jgi:predicted nucleic acid-binding protein